MKTEIYLTPEDEDEVEFLERLADAREFALDAGLERETVAAMFAQMSAGIAGEDGAVAEKEEELNCPECGTTLTDVTAAGIGEHPTTEPCGCTVEWDDIPPNYFE